MRALVVDGDVAFAKEVARALASRADVETLHDGAAALVAVRERSFDVVVSEWLLPGLEGVSLLRAMREAGMQSPFVMCTLLTQREAREYAIGAGVAEVLHKPISAGVVADAACARSLSSASTRLPAGSAASASMAAGTASLTPGGPGNSLTGIIAAGPASVKDLAKFCARPAWREVGKTLLKGLTAAIGQPLEEVPAANEISTDLYDARTTLAMVDVGSLVKLELGLFARFDDGAALASRALRIDAPKHEDVTEFFSEMCNQTLGAVKTAMRPGGLNFTLFVPRTRFVQGATGWSTQFPASRTVHVAQASGPRMMMVLGAKPCAVKSVNVAALRENMVIVEDLLDDDQSVLAEAACRLTAHTLVRIKTRAAGRRAPVQILE